MATKPSCSIKKLGAAPIFSVLTPRKLGAAVHSVCLAFLLAVPPGYAQGPEGIVLPRPGTMVHVSPAYNPPILGGMKIRGNDPFTFDFILKNGAGKEEDVKRIIRYFLAALTVPEKDLWVNLSPYEGNRIVPTAFGQTAMGRDLLAEDYLLKQVAASMLYPEDPTGKVFWNKVYSDAAGKLGTTHVPVHTVNKVWIVPERALVYENAHAGAAYIVQTKLKVLLEEDYLAKKMGGRKGKADVGTDAKASTWSLSPVLRRVIIPRLTWEVNHGRNFAPLRQVYNSLVLAQWYKKKIKESVLAQLYANKNKIKGAEYARGLADDVDAIYRRYLQAFKKGAYDYIKEDIDGVTGQPVPRKYFSGGVQMVDAAMVIEPMPGRAPAGMETVITVAIQPDRTPSPGLTTDLPGGPLPAVYRDVQQAIVQRQNSDAAMLAATQRTTAEGRNDDVLEMLFSEFFQKAIGRSWRDGRPHTFLNVGAGAFPYDTLKIKSMVDAMKMPGQRIQVIDSELPQSAPLAHIHSPLFMSARFKWFVAQLGFPEVTLDAIQDIYQVVNRDYQVTELVAKVRAHEREGYVTLGMDPQMFVLSFGRLLSAHDTGKKLFLLSRKLLAEHGVSPDRLKEIVDSGGRGVEEAVNIVKFPMEQVLNRAGIQYLVSADVAKSGMRNVSVITAMNVLMHHPDDEAEDAIDDMGKMLEEGGVLIVKDVNQTETGIHVFQKRGSNLVSLGDLFLEGTNSIGTGIFAAMSFDRIEWLNTILRHVQPFIEDSKKHFEGLGPFHDEISHALVRIMPKDEITSRVVGLFRDFYGVEIPAMVDEALTAAPLRPGAEDLGGIDLTSDQSLHIHKAAAVPDGGRLFFLDPHELARWKDVQGVRFAVVGVRGHVNLASFLGAAL